MAFLRIGKFHSRYVKITFALVVTLVLLNIDYKLKSDKHHEIISLVSLHKAFDEYNTDDWVFNYNVSQFSSTLRIKPDVACLESLIFMDIKEQDLTLSYLKENLKCLVLPKDNQLIL